MAPCSPGSLPAFVIQQRCNYVLFSGPWPRCGGMGRNRHHRRHALPKRDRDLHAGLGSNGTCKTSGSPGRWLTVTGTDSSENCRAILDCSESTGLDAETEPRPAGHFCSRPDRHRLPRLRWQLHDLQGTSSATGPNFGGHPLHAVLHRDLHGRQRHDAKSKMTPFYSTPAERIAALDARCGSG